MHESNPPAPEPEGPQVLDGQAGEPRRMSAPMALSGPAAATQRDSTPPASAAQLALNPGQPGGRESLALSQPGERSRPNELDPADPAHLSQPRVAWHRSLAAQLGLLFCGTLLVALLCTGLLVQALARRPAGPAPLHSHLAQNGLLLEHLLGSAQVKNSRVHFDPFDVDRVDQLLARVGCGFVILSSEMEVLTGTRRALEVLTPFWEKGRSRKGTVSYETAFDEPWTFVSLPVKNARLGELHVVELLMDSQAHAELHGVPVHELNNQKLQCYYHAQPEQLAELLSMARPGSQLGWWHTLLMLPLALLSAGLLSWLAAWLVTGRIRRLSAEAHANQTGAIPASVPFTEAGQDEIFGLARTMNRLRERNLELLSAMQSRDRQRRDWIAQVSHDLRTPLTALQSTLQRLQGLIATGAKAEIASSLELAQQDGARVVGLAEDLLEIARLEADPKLQLGPVPAGELARSAASSLRSRASDRQLALEVQLEAGLPIIEADGRLLLRALENLLSNAVHHAHSRVDLLVSVQGNWLVFTVRDDGTGFPAEHGRVDLKQMENRLSRRDSSGLGLKVALHVAEAHRGRIEARNPAQGGALIALCLPLW